MACRGDTVLQSNVSQWYQIFTFYPDNSYRQGWFSAG